MGVHVGSDGTYWVIINGTEEKSSPQVVVPSWRNIATIYARTWVEIEEVNESYARPSQMRVVEFNETSFQGNASTFIVENTDVRALYNESITRADFTSRWFTTARSASAHETWMADEIAGTTINITAGPEDKQRNSLDRGLTGSATGVVDSSSNDFHPQAEVVR